MVADVGCGNGKYLGVNPALYMLGSDRSRNLVQIARERGHEVMVCDTLRLPYRYGARRCLAHSAAHTRAEGAKHSISPSRSRSSTTCRPRSALSAPPARLLFLTGT